jgi:hypothetical protein
VLLAFRSSKAAEKAAQHEFSRLGPRPLDLVSNLRFCGGRGVAWRLFALWRLPATSAGGTPARQISGATNALQASLLRRIPHRGFHSSAKLVIINPHVFHIGLVLVFVVYGPHIAFIH